MEHSHTDRMRDDGSAGDHKVQDPVCEMVIPIDQAVEIIEHGGRRYHFCSEGCAKLFNKDPEAYTDPQRIYERKNAVMLHHLRGQGQEQERKTQGAAPAGSQVRDPVCEMFIDPADATDSVEYESKTYYFCRQECADRFKRNPDVYAPSDNDHIA